jgi:hypothetical protein
MIGNRLWVPLDELVSMGGFVAEIELLRTISLHKAPSCLSRTYLERCLPMLPPIARAIIAANIIIPMTTPAHILVVLKNLGCASEDLLSYLGQRASDHLKPGPRSYLRGKVAWPIQKLGRVG